MSNDPGIPEPKIPYGANQEAWIPPYNTEPVDVLAEHRREMKRRKASRWLLVMAVLLIGGTVYLGIDAAVSAHL